MKKIVLFILPGILALSSCKKYVKEKDLDKEIIIEISLNSVGRTINQAEFTTFTPDTYLVDFDKRDYAKVDSITLNVVLLTNSSTDTAVIRLFNVTDNVAIDNSTLSSSITNINEANQIRTNNLYKSLPDKRVTLALQGKGVRYGGAIYRAFLKLRRS